ncbi:MAG: hypothetical protein M3R70_01995 [Actinomycetota bacterium]|nr:hypothetical protein [Actinomycetota bacterium]
MNEPSHATAGRNVFYSGNWYAARSVNTGVNWTYIDPAADMADFCCDQDVVYDRGRNLHLWYRQGIYNAAPAPAGQNRIKLSASTNNGATFCTYTWTPTALNASYTNQWFDYPHLAVSNNFLYITTNMFDGATNPNFLRMVVQKLPLSTLASCSAISHPYWLSTSGWSWAPVQGATDTMYLGDHITTSTFRIYSQSEVSNTISFVDRAIPAWTATNHNAVCTIPNGRNPCARMDQRITTGWVGNSGAYRGIGFAWNVRAGGTFARPYINAAVFRDFDKAYLGRPAIYSPSSAFAYLSAAPNARGDLGASLIVVTNGQYPRAFVAMDDDYTVGNSWSLALGASSSTWLSNACGTGPCGDKMGDYTRTRAFYPVQTIWTSSNYVGVAGTTPGSVVYKPVYFVFGRGRDANSWIRFFNS